MNFKNVLIAAMLIGAGAMPSAAATESCAWVSGWFQGGDDDTDTRTASCIAASDGVRYLIASPDRWSITVTRGNAIVQSLSGEGIASPGVGTLENLVGDQITVTTSTTGTYTLVDIPG